VNAGDRIPAVFTDYARDPEPTDTSFFDELGNPQQRRNDHVKGRTLGRSSAKYQRSNSSGAGRTAEVTRAPCDSSVDLWRRFARGVRFQRGCISKVTLPRSFVLNAPGKVTLTSTFVLNVPGKVTLTSTFVLNVPGKVTLTSTFVLTARVKVT